MKITVRIDDQPFTVEIDDIHARPVIAVVEGERFEVWPEVAGESPVELTSPALTAPVEAPPSAGPVNMEDGRSVYAPIPGVIDRVSVKPGSLVKRGQELCVLEAMKMKNAIRAPRDGQIDTVQISVGQHVRHHEVLMTYAE